MKKIFQLGLLLSLMLIPSTVRFVSADTIIPQKNQSDQEELGESDQQSFELSLFDMGFEEPAILHGPYQEISTVFAIPMDWDIVSDVNIELKVNSKFQALLEALTPNDNSENLISGEGVIRVDINGIPVNETTLVLSGESTIAFDVAASNFKQNSQENELTISWDSEIACRYSINSILVIDPSSRLLIPYENKQVDPQLSDFPKPFYLENVVLPSPLAIVLPENPDEDDLSALMAVSAGLGKHSNDKLSYQVLLSDEISQESHRDYNMIFIGRQNILDNFLEEHLLELPFSLPFDHDNGVLAIQASSWNASRAVMFVTGKNEESLQKASAVIAAGDLLPFSNGNQAEIVDLSDPSTLTQLQVDYSLGEMVGEEELHINKLGKTVIQVPFHIPGNVQVNPDSFIELYFRHSQLINYLQSGLTISINGKLVGTIRFGDHSAETGLTRIVLPPNTIHPLKNELEFTFTIIPQDICADERSNNFWISVFKDSYLHLPPTLDKPSNQGTTNYLSDLLSTFLYDNSLKNLVFVLSRNDLQSWRYASDMSLIFGTYTKANILLPSVQFPETLNGNLEEKEYILIGLSDHIPFSSGINELLPLSFNQDGTINDIFLQGIQFKIHPDQQFGVLEVTGFSDSSAKVL